MPEDIKTEENTQVGAEVVDVSEEKTGGSNSVPMKRFNEVYGKQKELERQLAESNKNVSMMRDHNAELGGKIDKLSSAVEKTSEIKAESSISSLQKSRYEAMDEGDYDKAASIDDEIAFKREEKIRAGFKKDMETMTNSMKETFAQREERETIDRFTQQNPWFNENAQEYDADKRRYAVGADDYISNKNPNMPMHERLKRVAEDTNKFFSSKLNPDVDEQHHGGVESGGSSYPAVKNATTLNAEQKNVARVFYPEMSKKEAEDTYLKQMNFSK